MLKRWSIFALAAVAVVSAAALSVAVSAVVLSATSISAEAYQIFRAPQGSSIHIAALAYETGINAE
jgi:hypothetical protein